MFDSASPPNTLEQQPTFPDFEPSQSTHTAKAICSVISINEAIACTLIAEPEGFPVADQYKSSGVTAALRKLACEMDLPPEGLVDFNPENDFDGSVDLLRHWKHQPR